MNGDLQIRLVDTAGARKRFASLPFRLYRDDPNWVPPLRHAQRKLFAGRTAFFDHAAMALFLAERSGTPVGRIAAVHNQAHSDRYQDGVGFFGFFECDPSDAEAARALLDRAEGWLAARGLTAVRGPVNPSMNHDCGLLVEGFDSPPMALMPYNPPSYGGLLESLGLRKCKDLYAYLIKNDTVQPGTEAGDRMVRLAAALHRRHPEVTLRRMNKGDYPRDILRFIDLFEEARHNNWGCVPLTPREIREMAAEMKPVLDPELIVLAEVRGEPAGALLAIPNFNPALAAVKGRMLPLGFLRFFRELRRADTLRVFGVAVTKKYRPLGVTAMLFLEAIIRSAGRSYRAAEASWVLEDNHMSDSSIRNALNPQRYKTYRIYEKPIGPQPRTT
jgi:hypothetical protein